MPKLKVEGLGFTDIIPDKIEATPIDSQFVTINPANIGIETI